MPWNHDARWYQRRADSGKPRAPIYPDMTRVREILNRVEYRRGWHFSAGAGRGGDLSVVAFYPGPAGELATVGPLALAADAGDEAVAAVALALVVSVDGEAAREHFRFAAN